MTYAEILTTISTVVAVLGYFHERKKREELQIVCTELKTTLQLKQESSQKVIVNLHQAESSAEKIAQAKEMNAVQEELKNLRQEITYATSTTASTIAISAPPIASANALTQAFYSTVLGAKVNVVKGKKPWDKDKEQK